ncbi:hypothetical protein BDN70DRAFT_876796, partial [Pholiota conissans]
VPGGARTENLHFAVVEDSPVDVLLDVSWLMERGINVGEYVSNYFWLSLSFSQHLRSTQPLAFSYQI